MGEGERLLLDAGVYAKAGTSADERIITHLGRHRVRVVPTVSLSYEERRAERGEEELIREFLAGQSGPFTTVRTRLYEKLKSCYVPFSEADSGFQAPGKRKQIVKGVLLEPRPEKLYLADIDAGSRAILPEASVRYLRDGLTSLYAMLSRLTVRNRETRGKKRRIPRVGYHTIRLQTRYDGDRIATVGDAHVHHAVDCACYFLTAMININKERILAGAPLTEKRFDPNSSVEKETLFQYSQDFIVDAALGVLLHALGFAQSEIHQTVSTSTLIDGVSAAEQRRIKILQRNVTVLKNLIRDRHDISSISRMMLVMQKIYPDGSGYPPPNENRYLHEFVRLFQIIALYDELTNPVTSHTPFSRMEVIQYLRDRAGSYLFDRERFTPQSRFDAALLEGFLRILAPFEPGEKVYLYNGERRNAFLFVGRVHSYLEEPIPLISILKDERSGKTYPFGRLVFHIPSSTGLFMEQGRVIKRIKADWIGGLQIHDLMLNPGRISEHQDLLYGSEMPLAKGVRRL